MNKRDLEPVNLGCKRNIFIDKYFSSLLNRKEILLGITRRVHSEVNYAESPLCINPDFWS